MIDHYYTCNASLKKNKDKLLYVKLFDKLLKLKTHSSIFSAKKLDKGTSCLLKSLKKMSFYDYYKKIPQIVILDLGCGWGPLSLAIAIKIKNATIYAIDVNLQCLKILNKNKRILNLKNIIVLKPDKINKNIAFDCIVSNPPIRIGRKKLINLLKFWISKLRINGKMFLVIPKNMGAIKIFKELFKDNNYKKKFIIENVYLKGYQISIVRKLIN